MGCRLRENHRNLYNNTIKKINKLLISNEYRPWSHSGAHHAVGIKIVGVFPIAFYYPEPRCSFHYNTVE